MKAGEVARAFLMDLDINLNLIAEGGAQELLEECTKIEEPISGIVGAEALSTLNRIQQATYYKALDVFNQALRNTLFALDEDRK